MEPRIIAYIVCSSFSLVCIYVQLCFLVRSAIRLERADRRPSTGIEMIRPPTYIRRAKQVLPVITATSGLTFCCCNIGFRSEGRPNTVGFME